MLESKRDYYNYYLCILVWSVVLLNENMLSFMLKSYNGDIYNNMFVLIVSGAFASYLALVFLTFFSPVISLLFAFVILTLSSSLVYPSMSWIESMLPLF